jgi:hypothetical protein
MPFELPLLTKRTVLSLPVHAVNDVKHPRKLPTLVDGQEAGSVISVWFSHIQKQNFVHKGTYTHPSTFDSKHINPF